MAQAINYNKKDEWYTPPELVKELALATGRDIFDYDPCPGPHNWLIKHGVVREVLPGQILNSSLFVNPPFSDKELFIRQAIVGAGCGNVSYVLLPDSTETRWFQIAGELANCFITLKKRVQFIDGATLNPVKNNTGGSVIFQFGPKEPINISPDCKYLKDVWRKA